MVKAVVAQLKDFGHPRRGWLGVRIQQVTPDIAESLGLKDASGAMVAGVNDGGPADKAKIHNGDIILKFNNRDMKEMRTLPRIVANPKSASRCPWCCGATARKSACRPRWPRSRTTCRLPPPQRATRDRREKPTEISGLGLKLAPISQETKDKFSLGADQKGVVITDVAPNSSAAERGLKAGDVIVEVQQGEVWSPAEVQKKVDTVRKENRKSVLMLIQRQDG